MEYPKDETPKVTITRQPMPDGSYASHIASVFYSRILLDEIQKEVVSIIQEGVQRALSEDADFRAKVSAAIEHATATLPIETIAQTVREVLKGNQK